MRCVRQVRRPKNIGRSGDPTPGAAVDTWSEAWGAGCRLAAGADPRTPPGTVGPTPRAASIAELEAWGAGCGLAAGADPRTSVGAATRRPEPRWTRGRRLGARVAASLRVPTQEHRQEPRARLPEPRWKRAAYRTAHTATREGRPEGRPSRLLGTSVLRKRTRTRRGRCSGLRHRRRSRCGSWQLPAHLHRRTRTGHPDRRSRGLHRWR